MDNCKQIKTKIPERCFDDGRKAQAVAYILRSALENQENFGIQLFNITISALKELAKCTKK